MPALLLAIFRSARRLDAPLLRTVIRRHPRLSRAPAEAQSIPETTMLKTVLAATAAVALTASAAQAQNPSTISQRLTYARTGETAQAFVARLDSAAAKVCDPQRKGQKGLEAEAAFRACRTATVRRAVDQLGDAEVARLMRQPVTARTAVAIR
jgi:UrcA family protein